MPLLLVLGLLLLLLLLVLLLLLLLLLLPSDDDDDIDFGVLANDEYSTVPVLSAAISREDLSCS